MPKDNNGSRSLFYRTNPFDGLFNQMEIKTVLIEDKSKIPAFLRSGFRVFEASS
jgi:hypothetical protein